MQTHETEMYAVIRMVSSVWIGNIIAIMLHGALKMGVSKIKLLVWARNIFYFPQFGGGRGG